ncbi:MAG: arginase family protein [Bdellovibrionales bacterium]|nr:arginase family protein [Bdellovibrionales bacterium]
MGHSVASVIRAPGYGLLTVTSGSAGARSFFAKHFRGQDPVQWHRIVESRVAESSALPCLLGVPSDSGGGICRGAAHGPLALREALYRADKRWRARDLGDIPCIPQLVHDSMLSEMQLHRSGTSLWGKDYSEKCPVAPLSILEAFLTEAYAHSSFRLLMLGGDHSVSGPVFSALERNGRARHLAVLHLDAHTDLLEDRFGVEHCFGTWTSHAVRRVGNPAAWVQLGNRVSGQSKKHWESKFGLRQIWAKEVARMDPDKFADKLLADWQRLGCDSLYVTHDIDGTDPKFAPATGTPESGGLNAPWLTRVLKRLTRELPLVGSDMVEVAPVLGSPAQAKRTVATALKYMRALEWSA